MSDQDLTGLSKVEVCTKPTFWSNSLILDALEYTPVYKVLLIQLTKQIKAASKIDSLLYKHQLEYLIQTNSYHLIPIHISPSISKHVKETYYCKKSLTMTVDICSYTYIYLPINDNNLLL